MPRFRKLIVGVLIAGVLATATFVAVRAATPGASTTRAELSLATVLSGRAPAVITSGTSLQSEVIAARVLPDGIITLAAAAGRRCLVAADVPLTDPLSIRPRSGQAPGVWWASVARPRRRDGCAAPTHFGGIAWHRHARSAS